MPTILYYTSVVNLTGNYHLQVRLFNRRHQINQRAFIHGESTPKKGRRLMTEANYVKYSLLVELVKGKINNLPLAKTLNFSLIILPS